ncbi:hypothetical protein ET33_33730 [Paenibacillus tyrfis]|uniref:Uncharacterized protein n=1 Tax=Paenibacillus tyrfis TaxID=1501230 RepID=A0A081NTM6_9BACL|nr:hypothetical protein ET33_33730 [Paenibacillus tyrfis]
MQDITYLKKHNCFYILMTSAEEEGKTEVLVIPCEKFPSMDHAWEKRFMRLAIRKASNLSTIYFPQRKESY